MALVPRLEREPLTPELIEKATKELRETPEVREAALKELKELLNQRTDINISQRDDILLRYLRPTKFYSESALNLIVRECEFKQKHANVLKDLTAEKLEKQLLDDCPVNVLANRDQDGRRVLIAQCGKNWNTSKCSSDQMFQLFYLIHEAALMEPSTQVNGVVVMLDFVGLGMTHLARFTPNMAFRLLTFIQKAMPLRLKQVHIVNQPGIFSVVWKLFKPFIEEKLNKRLYFHGDDRKSLHKFMDPAFLPKDYGGQLPEINYGGKDWYPLIRTLDDTINENNTFGKKDKK